MNSFCMNLLLYFIFPLLLHQLSGEMQKWVACSCECVYVKMLKALRWLTHI